MKIASIFCLLFFLFVTCVFGAENQESEDNICQEPLYLNWFGPFQPTGGSNEDSNSPLTFLHGLWYHINNMDELKDKNLAARRQIRLPPLDVFLKSFRRSTGSTKNNGNENNENDDDDNFDVRDEDDEEANDNDNDPEVKLINKFENLLKLEQKHRFPELTPIEQHLFNSDTQQYFANLLSNLAIPPEKREGEREIVPNADSEFRCRLPTLSEEANNFSSSKITINRRYSIRLLGANNFAINSKNPRSGDHHHPHQQQQQRTHLPASHIVEYGAAFRVGNGQSIFTSPHEPANWLSLPVDPSRMVVVCQAFSPSQWAVPFPSGAAEFSGLCPPSKASGVKLRIGRIGGQLLSKQMIEMSSMRKRAVKSNNENVVADLIVENSFTKPTSTRKQNSKFQVGYRLSKSQWSERIQEMDQVWVTSSRFKNVLDGMMMKITKNGKSSESKLKVIPEPIDTELWRRDDRFFTQAYEKVFENTTKNISSSLWRSVRHFDVFNETHAAKMNRNLELLTRLSMLNPSFLLQEKMQSSFLHYLSFLNSTNLNRSVVFAFPTQVQNVAPRQSLVHQYFFYEATDAPEMFSSWKDETFKYLTGHNDNINKPRIFTSIFAWNSHSGFDNLLRTFVESFGGRSGNETPPVLILRTAGVSNEEFALDIPRTLDLFIEMTYAPNISSGLDSVPYYQDSYQAEKYFIDLLSPAKQAELFEEDKLKAKSQENEWMQEFLELYGGKLTAEQRKLGLKRVPVADRSLALRLALFQRKKMEMELILAKKINNKNNYFTQLCNKFLPQLRQHPEEFDCDKIHHDVSGEGWRSFMRRRLMFQNSSIEATSFNLIQKRRNTRSRAQKQQEVTSLPTRPHVLVLLSSTSASADASHFQHSRSVGLDLEKFRVLIASSDVIVSAARGDASAEGENLRQFQEAASLAVPVMSPVAAAAILGNKKTILHRHDEDDEDSELVNVNRSFVVPFDFVRDRFFAHKFEAEVNSPMMPLSSTSVNTDREGSFTFWFEPSTKKLSRQLVKMSKTSEEMTIEMLKKGLKSRKFLVEKHDSFVVAKLVLDSIHELVN